MLYLLAYSPFHLVFPFLLVSRAARTLPPCALPCPEYIPPPCYVLTLLLSILPKIFFLAVVSLISFFSLNLFSFSLAFSLGHAFSLNLTLFWFRFFDRGRSIFKVPRRGNRPLHSMSRTNKLTAHLSPSSHESPGSTTHIALCSLTIDPDQSQQSKRHTNPECSDHSHDASRRLPDETAPSRDHCSQTEYNPLSMTTNPPESDEHGTEIHNTKPHVGQYFDFEVEMSLSKNQLSDGQGGPQCCDHRSVLPQSSESLAFLTEATSTHVEQEFLEGRDEDGASREESSTSCYALENDFPPPREGPLNGYKVLFNYKFLSQEGTYQPGMVGI